MKRLLESDLARLERLAFKRRERCGPLVRRFHELAESIELLAEAEWIWNVYDWLLVPLTLWPIDFEGVAQHTIRIVEDKVKMDRAFGLLLRMLKGPPARKTQDAIAKYEHDIEQGRYHGMLPSATKVEPFRFAASCGGNSPCRLVDGSNNVAPWLKAMVGRGMCSFGSCSACLGFWEPRW